VRSLLISEQVGAYVLFTLDAYCELECISVDARGDVVARSLIPLSEKENPQTPRKPSGESFQGFPGDDYEEEVAEIPFAVSSYSTPHASLSIASLSPPKSHQGYLAG